MTVQHSVVQKTQMLPRSSYYSKCYVLKSMHQENVQSIVISGVVGIRVQGVAEPSANVSGKKGSSFCE